jgi:hypothetical protein
MFRNDFMEKDNCYNLKIGLIIALFAIVILLTLFIVRENFTSVVYARENMDNIPQISVRDVGGKLNGEPPLIIDSYDPQVRALIPPEQSNNIRMIAMNPFSMDGTLQKSFSAIPSNKGTSQIFYNSTIIYRFGVGLNVNENIYRFNKTSIYNDNSNAYVINKNFNMIAVEQLLISPSTTPFLTGAHLDSNSYQSIMMNDSVDRLVVYALRIIASGGNNTKDLIVLKNGKKLYKEFSFNKTKNSFTFVDYLDDVGSTIPTIQTISPMSSF